MSVLLLLPLLGCGGQDEIVVTVLDASNKPVSGVEIRQVGRNQLLGTTDARGQAPISPAQGAGEIRIELHAASKDLDFENPYTLDEDAFRIGKLPIRARVHREEEETTASLRVTTEPEGAIIYFDGAVVGTTNTVLTDLSTGTVLIELKMDGMQVESYNRYLPAGQNELDVAMVPLAAATATLTVNSEPNGAAVSLNGKSTGELTPSTFTDLAPGEYTVRVTKKGYKAETTRVPLRAGRSGRVDLGPLASTRPAAPPRNVETSTDKHPPKPPVGNYSRKYSVSTVPGWAEVYVDGDSENRNVAGNFRITLKAGVHRFRVVKARDGVNVVLKYTVKPGDRNGKLLLDWKRHIVDARP